MARGILSSHRVVTAGRPGVTGVASPCPEFYVREREREREREYYDGASTVTEPVWVTLYQADGGLEALLLRR